MNNYQGKRVLIIGAARQGLALARYMVNQGASVTLNDKQSADQMRSTLDQMTDFEINWVLGEHPLSLLDATDLVCISGGVPLTLPLVATALQRGIPVTNDSQVFMENVKAPVVGITGSAGKTTTTTLFGRMAEAEIKPPQKAWIGGNIGNPLIEFVDDINANDLVIQELSSFQLELMTTSPHVAAVLNITPNHLDRHAGMAEYIRAKAHIIDFQKADDIAVLNREDRESWNLRNSVRGTLVSFGRQESNSSESQVYLKDNWIFARRDGVQTALLDTALISLRGSHNLMNVMAACTLAFSIGFNPDSMAAGVTGFYGVNHRLQLVREVNGVSWINDSIATAPERTLAALNTITEPLVLLLGGRDKNLPWDDLAAVIHKRVEHVILFGEAAEKIHLAIGDPFQGSSLRSISLKTTLVEALEEARRVAVPGDVVLLSPGCTSYDAFKDFEERGNFYSEWVNAL